MILSESFSIIGFKDEKKKQESPSLYVKSYVWEYEEDMNGKVSRHINSCKTLIRPPPLPL